jgi:altronate dehydratase large subunit
MSFLGYVRPDGKVGIRNHVVVIASVSCANGVVDGITRALPEIKGITHTEGCGRGPADLVTTTRMLAGLGKNPNVAGVLVVGLGCEFIKAPWVASEIQGSGKPTETLVIQGEGGSQATTRKAIELVRKMLDDASRVERRPVDLDRLVVGLDCGDEGDGAAKAVGACTDWLLDRGATVVVSEAAGFAGVPELAERSAGPDLAKRLEELIEQQQRFAQRVLPIVSKRGMNAYQPERPRASFEKCGKAKVSGVLEYGSVPEKAGLYLMDTPSSELFAMSGLAAGGAHIILHATAEGSLGGVSITPVVKVATRSELFAALSEDLDFDAASGATFTDTGRRLGELVSEVAGGKRTRTEENGLDVFAINTVGPAF